MDSYVDVSALVRVLLYSLVAGVLVTGSFAVGARVYSGAETARAAARPAVLRFTLAGLCFAVAAVGAVVGVWFVLDK